MPRKLDFSKVVDIGLEDTKDTNDVKSIVNTLIPTKPNISKEPIENQVNSVAQPHALSHASSAVLTHALSQSLTPTNPTSINIENLSLPKAKNLINSSQEINSSEITIKDMAKWHTDTEQKVYKAMISETQKQVSSELYFSFQQLSARTGFKNRRTIIAALNGLVSKQSITILVDRHGDHFGKCYKVFSPAEILERRKQSQMQIHPQTKKILQMTAIGS